MILHVLLLLLACDSKAPEKPAPPPEPAPKVEAPAPTPPAASAAPTALTLPPALVGKAEVVPSTDPAYAQAHVADAVKPAGDGGISEALVVKLTADIPVYRLWSGPAKVDGNGNTNRIGSWWSYDAPTGTRDQYRIDYEICTSWNDLTWVVTCTLKAGAVIAVGPGQSVSAATCGDPTGKESYPANPVDWQTFIYQAYNQVGPGKALDCPAATQDYEDNPNDISQPLHGNAAPASPEAKKPAVLKKGPGKAGKGN
jgi:hypothetical protein